MANGEWRIYRSTKSAHLLPITSIKIWFFTGVICSSAENRFDVSTCVNEMQNLGFILIGPIEEQMRWKARHTVLANPLKQEIIGDPGRAEAWIPRQLFEYAKHGVNKSIRECFARDVFVVFSLTIDLVVCRGPKNRDSAYDSPFLFALIRRRNSKRRSFHHSGVASIGSPLSNAARSLASIASRTRRC